jgi:hypothetical protein
MDLSKYPDKLEMEQISHGSFPEFHIVWMTFMEFAEEFYFDAGANVGDPLLLDRNQHSSELSWVESRAVHTAIEPFAEGNTFHHGFTFSTEARAKKALAAGRKALKAAREAKA